MESLLGVKIFEVIGPQGGTLRLPAEVLYPRAKPYWTKPARWRERPKQLAAGWEAELRLSVEIIFPTWLLLQCFARFAEERPQTRLELYESVLSGTEEALATTKG